MKASYFRAYQEHFMTRMEAGIMGFALGIIFWALLLQIHQHKLEKEAHECAVTSIRTDWAIEQCYYVRGLPFPGY